MAYNKQQDKGGVEKGCGVVALGLGAIFLIATLTSGGNYVLAVVFIGFGIFLLSRAGTMKKSVTETVNNSWNAEQEFLQINEIKAFTLAGKYVTGHPAINDPISRVKVFITGDEAALFATISQPGNTDAEAREIGRIPLREITDIKAEDRSTFETRVTATRMLAMGVFAFAAKKQEKHESYYVTVSWKDGKFTQDTVFEFDGPQSAPQSNALKNFFIQSANALEADEKSNPQEN